MMRYTCQACCRGMHDLCAGREAPPPGMMGGSECICEGDCAKRVGKQPPDELSKLIKLTEEMAKEKAK